MQQEIAQFYSQSQLGNGSMPVFVGSRRGQMGGGFFSSLARFAIPILKNIGRGALRVVGRTATDYLDHQRPLGAALVDNALREVQSAIFSPTEINKQEGSGHSRKRKLEADDIFTNKRRRKHHHHKNRK
jgi:hypothetical protein